MSTIYKRRPGRFCGPFKKRCKNRPEDWDKVENPPAEGAFWIDGINTEVKERQGVKHVENYNAIIIGANTNKTDSNDETTLASETTTALNGGGK